jgi:hypothetical protein
MTYAGIVTASSAVTKIAGTTVDTAVGSIDFSSIPQTYTSLQLDVVSKSTSGNNTDLVLLRINGATSAYTVFHNTLATTDTNPDATVGTGQTSIPIGVHPGTGSAFVGISRVFIPNYTNATFWKIVEARGANLGNTGTHYSMRIMQGQWQDTAAVTSLSVLSAAGNMNTGSVATLYGLA